MINYVYPQTCRIACYILATYSSYLFPILSAVWRLCLLCRIISFMIIHDLVFIADVMIRIIYSCAFYKILISDESLVYINMLILQDAILWSWISSKHKAQFNQLVTDGISLSFSWFVGFYNILEKNNATFVHELYFIFIIVNYILFLLQQIIFYFYYSKELVLFLQFKIFK